MRRWAVACVVAVACGNHGYAPGGVPGAVSGVSATPLVESILLAWSAPPSATPITSYEIVDDVGTVRASGTTTLLVAGLAPGSSYCFQIAARNAAGRGPPSARTCAWPYASTVAAPLAVHAEPIPGGARVSWIAPQPGYGPPLGGFDVAIQPAAPTARHAPTATMDAITGLDAGVTYTFLVTARAAGFDLVSAAVASNPVTISAALGWRAADLPGDGARAIGVVGERLVVVASTTIYAAQLGADGAPGPWQVAGSREARTGEYGTSFAIAARDGDSGTLVATTPGQEFSGTARDVLVAPIRDGSVGALTPGPPLALGARDAGTAADGRHVWILGGLWWSGGSYTGIGSSLVLVQVTGVGADGQLGPWRTTAPLPRADAWQAVAHGGWLYALASNGAAVDVFRAEIGADGTLGPFRRASSQPDASLLGGLSVAADGDFLYLAGAEVIDPRLGGTAPVLLVGRLGADGDVVAWTRSAAAPNPAAPLLLAHAGRLYVAGRDTPAIRWAPVDPTTGDVAPSPEQPSPRPPSAPLRVRATPLDGAAHVSWDAPVDDGGAPITGFVVRPATFGGPDGEVAVGADTRDAVFPGLANLSPQDAVAFQVFAKNAAGEGPGSGPTDTVVASPSPKWRASEWVPAFGHQLFTAGEDLFADGPRRMALPVDADGMPWTEVGPGWEGNSGTLHQWAQATRRVDDATSCVYEIGGSEYARSASSTYVRCVRADGFFGEDLSSTLEVDVPAPRSRGAAAIAGDVLSVAGGERWDDAGTRTTPLDDVIVARLRADGGVGAWRAATPLPEPMPAPALVARGDALLLLHRDRLLRATVRADGSLSAWQTFGPALPADASGARLAIVGDRLYVIAPGALYVSGLDAAGALTAWESHPDDAPPPLPVDAFDVAVVGDRLYLWGDALLVVARVEPATGRLRAWP